MNKRKSKLGIIRIIVQAIVLLSVFLFGLNNFLGNKSISHLPSISTHNTCPFGGIETAYSWITTGGFVSKIHSSAFILFIIGLVVVVLFGAIFCGFICPFGAVQEWIGKLGKKLFPKRFNRLVPPKADKVLRFLRYAVLAKILYETAVVGKLVFEAYDPYYAMMNFFSREVVPTAFIFLGVVLVLSLFIERPFCKYFCPYGAVLGLVGRFSVFKVRRDPSSCINCKKCDGVCPMNINISDKGTITGHHCISCYKCVSGEACPIDNALTITTKVKSESITAKKESVVAAHEN